MLRRRFTTDDQPRRKKGAATQATTGVVQEELEPDVQMRSEPCHQGDPDMSPHLEDDSGEGERPTDPEAPAEVHELRIGARLPGGRHGLERHSADRAVSRGVAHDLRIHRAGIAGARGRRPGRDDPTPEKFVRGGLEARPAPSRAEEVTLAGMRDEVLRRRAMNPHPAYRISRFEVLPGCRGKLRPAGLGAEVVSVPRMVQREPCRRRIDLHSAHGISCNRRHGRIDGRLHQGVRDREREPM